MSSRDRTDWRRRLARREEEERWRLSPLHTVVVTAFTITLAWRGFAGASPRPLAASGIVVVGLALLGIDLALSRASAPTRRALVAVRWVVAAAFVTLGGILLGRVPGA